MNAYELYNLHFVVLDFETKSMEDLKVAGGDRYCWSETTDVLCLCVIDDKTGREFVWRPGEAIPDALLAALRECDNVVAHNARFDAQIWEAVMVQKYKAPPIPYEKWYCSAAMCRVNGYPGGLDDAARALNPRFRKDHRGTALIKACSTPPFDTDPAKLHAMERYCMQDCRLVLELIRALRPLSEVEHAEWIVNERINDRGVMIDRNLCELACTYAEREMVEISNLVYTRTNGAVNAPTQHARLKKWLVSELDDYTPQRYGDDHPLDLINRGTDREPKYSLDKSARQELLSAQMSGRICLEPEVVEVIELTDEANRSSVAKFKTMMQRADDMDRVTGSLLYAGAGQTKRFSAQGLQVHNFSRSCAGADEAEDIIWKMASGEEFDNCLSTLTRMLRPAIIPAKGNVFVVGDWSGIEARALPWLTDDPEAESVLDVFRSGEDIYMHTAREMKVDDRFIGKVATLALGYQGGVGAFSVMARNYGVSMSATEVEQIVTKWRRANNWAVNFWAALERAAIKACRNEGELIPVGRVAYYYTKKLSTPTLLCQLPDNSMIQYPDCKYEVTENGRGEQRLTYLKARFKPAADATSWPRGQLYGGLLAENITQATCACLLRESLRKLDDVVLHIHDEIVLEVPADTADRAAANLKSVMEDTPSWADGLPLEAEPAIMRRYGK